MAWHDKAVFYHIYPLGLTGAPKQNSYEKPVHRLNTLIPWISHIKAIGCNALYIGPLFESVGHGYETTDYKKLDSRLGDNEDLKNFVSECHRQGIRVILDGVFNHTGRDFFAFQDLKKNRENSPYKDWYCNVNFWGNNEYNDGFSYQNWGGYDLLIKLNQHNPAVRDYICDVIRFWVKEFDIDGIRLDAADVMEFDYMRAFRQVAEEVKPEFWLMGEVIHGDYTRWVNENTLHSVTNYHLHKALYSGHNDHNFFEIAHTVKRLYGMGGNRPDGLKLYNFVDNHDVERIYTKLTNKAHFVPVHILLYTLPGIPSVYYGSEFGIEGKKERYSDDSLRPALQLSDYADAVKTNPHTRLIAALGGIRQAHEALSYGDYQELLLKNRQYAFSRSSGGEMVVVTVNNDDSDFVMNVPAGAGFAYVGALSGQRVDVNDGRISVNVKANSGEIWVPLLEGEGPEDDDVKAQENVLEAVSEKRPENQEKESGQAIEFVMHVDESGRAEKRKEAAESEKAVEPENRIEPNKAAESKKDVKLPELNKTKTTEPENMTESKDQIGKESKKTAGKPGQADKPGETANSDKETEAFERGTIAGLQEAILAIMEKNGPITDQMRRDVTENVYHDSLINWVKSFH